MRSRCYVRFTFTAESSTSTRLSEAPTVQNDADCAKAALALVPDAPSTE
jgi:hypothetical protein